MCILICARHDLKQNLDWNRIKFPLFQRGLRGIYHIKSAINLAACNRTDTHIIIYVYPKLHQQPNLLRNSSYMVLFQSKIDPRD
jgi:hypothetical protein